MNNRISQKGLALSSLALLVLSCLDNSLLGNIVKVLWLLSFVLLCWLNLGYSFGILIISLSIYNAKHVWDPGPIMERIDNFALGLFIVFAVLFRLRRKDLQAHKKLFLLLIVAFLLPLAKAVLNNSLNWYILAQLFRTYLLPIGVFVLLKMANVSKKEMNDFFLIMTILGIYMGSMAVLEYAGIRNLLIPSWLGDPNINASILGARSGGLLMQPEFNGLALALIAGIIYRSIEKKQGGIPIMAIGALPIVFGGAYVSYTRAVWLSMIVAAVVLLFGGAKRFRYHKVATVLQAGLILGLVLLIVVFPSATTNARAGDQGTINYRLNLWGAALEMAMTNILFGKGLSQFEEYAPDYQVKWSMIPKAFIPKKGTGTHNIFLNLLVEQGLFGLFLYSIIILLIYKSASEKAKWMWGKHGRYWIWAFFIIYYLNTQFINPHEPVTNLIFYGTLGIIAGIQKSDMTSDSRMSWA